MNRTRVTSRDVAERAGVSRTTVSFVLNGVATKKISAVTRQRVLDAARELGYVPDAAARTLVSGKTGTLGLVVSQAEHIRIDAFIPQTLYSLTQVCGEHNYRLLVETSERGKRTYEYDQLVGAKQIDGLVVLNPDPGDGRLRELIERGFPLVLLGGYPDPAVATVSVDSASGMDAAVSHLIRLGHRRIGFIHYRPIGDHGAGGRLGGYRAALERAGIAYELALVRSGDYSAESGFQAMRSLLRDGAPPTAVAAGNDTIAIGAMAAIAEAGLRMPDDVAIVGFDDIPLARYSVPALTTVRVPAAAMARCCGEMVVALITGTDAPARRRMFQPDLIVRHSCGARQLAEPITD